jgi:hypothetical protein
MDDIALKAILKAEKAAALTGGIGNEGSTLTEQRSSAMDYYLGDISKDMPSIEGRSSAVSTDVADTVDGIMPSLMDIFTSSDEVAKFSAVGEEDEEAAQQETDYVNHVFWNDNPGFVVLHSMVKDALIQKNGVVKFWWEEGEEEKRETYESLTKDAYAMLVADKTVEIIEHTEHPDPAGMYAPNAGDVRQDMQAGGSAQTSAPGALHDVTVICRKPYGRVKVMAVPPDEFGIAKGARSIAESRYCNHTVLRTRSELISEGYSREIIDNLPAGTDVTNQEQQSRATVDDTGGATADVNKQMQEIEVTEHYIRLDYDDDGVAELRKVKTAGSGMEILDNEPFDGMPFAAITPILMSHQFFGRSLADVVNDIQKIKTALLRSMLDSAYFASNQRVEVSEQHATENTLDDLLTNRPGSVVRTKMPGGILPIPTQSVAGEMFPALEYMDQVRETRTGVTRNAVGPDADTLNKFAGTATGQNILATAAQQRIRMIARTFAETGIKDLFLGIHALILKHGEDARKVKLRDQWVEVNPRNWKTRKDMTVMVGLGTGTRDQVNAYLMNILGMQTQALTLQGSAGGPVVTLTNVYNTLRKLTENAGFRSADPFFTKPTPQDEEKAKQPPPPDPKLQALQMKAQTDQQKAGMDMQAKQQDMEIKREAAQMDIQKSILEMRLEMQKFMMEMNMKRQEFALDQQQDQARFGQEMQQTALAGHVNIQQTKQAGEQKLELAERAADQKSKQMSSNPRFEGGGSEG